MAEEGDVLEVESMASKEKPGGRREAAGGRAWQVERIARAWKLSKEWG